MDGQRLQASSGAWEVVWLKGGVLGKWLSSLRNTGLFLCTKGVAAEPLQMPPLTGGLTLEGVHRPVQLPPRMESEAWPSWRAPCGLEL